MSGEIMAPIDFKALTSSLLGGLALSLYGMGRMTTSLKAGAGSQLRGVLKRMCKNRVLGMLTGMMVTALLNSSSASSVMLVAFVEEGYITFQESIGALLGVNIGTTVTVHLMAFNLTKYSLEFITIGYIVFAFSPKESRIRHLGESLIGLGLMFFGFDMMGNSMRPLREYSPFLDFLVSIDNTWSAILVSTIFTLAIQSSAAVLGIVMALARQGFLSHLSAVAMVLGANLGTTGTALVVSLGKKTDTLRVAVAYVVLKAAGIIAIAPVLETFISIMYKISGESGVFPTTKEERGVTVPGAIPLAHSVFNVFIALAFLPFTGVVAYVVEKIVPDGAKKKLKK
ncbi:hypothetical protein AAMO2058_001443300 [Amorphochlora amoebiformis]